VYENNCVVTDSLKSYLIAIQLCAIWKTNELGSEEKTQKQRRYFRTKTDKKTSRVHIPEDVQIPESEVRGETERFVGGQDHI
jgi:hypothetical protein